MGHLNSTEERVNIMSEKKLNYGFLSVNVLYLVCAALFLIIGAYVQAMDIMSGLVITEYALILLPVFLLGLATRVDLKKALRFKKLRWKHTGIIAAIAFLLLPVILTSNLVVVTILSYFGKMSIQTIPTASNGVELIIFFFVVAISPGICEEVFFRGMVLSAYEKQFDAKWGIILTALLFGLFHFNLQNLMGPIVLGIVFGYLVIITDSIWASVIAHTVNNGLSVIMQYVMRGAANGTTDMAQDPAAVAEAFQMNAMLVALAFMFVLCIVLLFFVSVLINIIKRDMMKFECDSIVLVNKKRFRIIKNENKYLNLIKEEEYSSELSLEENIANGKSVHMDTLMKYRVEFPKAAVDLEKKDSKLNTATVIKMVPIFATVAIYIIMWVGYLGRA